MEQKWKGLPTTAYNEINTQHTKSEMSIYSIWLQWQIKLIHQSSPNEHNHINKWSEIVFKLKRKTGRGHDHCQLLGMIKFTHSFIDEGESSKKLNDQCLSIMTHVMSHLSRINPHSDTFLIPANRTLPT